MATITMVTIITKIVIIMSYTSNLLLLNEISDETNMNVN